MDIAYLLVSFGWIFRMSGSSSQARRLDNPRTWKAASLVDVDPGGNGVVVTSAELSMITVLSTVGISSALLVSIG